MWNIVFPAMPGAGSRFAASSDTNLLLFVNIKTFQLDEYKINVDKTAVWHSGGCILKQLNLENI